MFEVWEKKGGKHVLLARFKLEKDAQAHVDHYRGDGELEIRVPSQPPKRRHSKSRFVAAKEHEEEFIADVTPPRRPPE